MLNLITGNRIEKLKRSGSVDSCEPIVRFLDNLRAKIFLYTQ